MADSSQPPKKQPSPAKPVEPARAGPSAASYEVLPDGSGLVRLSFQIKVF